MSKPSTFSPKQISLKFINKNLSPADAESDNAILREMDMSAQRYQTKEKAAVEVYGRNGSLIASLKNLSESGACIEWTQEEFSLAKGDLVLMTVFLKALNRKHKVNAEVIWRDGKKSGLTFIHPTQVLEKMIDKT